MQVTEETKALAQGIYDYLLMNPEKHDQDSWFKFVTEQDEDVVTEQNICNTTMCVAGTAVWLTEGVAGLNVTLADNVDDEYFDKKGRRLLGLTHEEADTLFYNSNEEQALELVKCLANGDSEKFNEIAEIIDSTF